MTNITLSVNDDIIKKVRKIAIDKNTTLTSLIRNYLNSIVENYSIEKKSITENLKKSFDCYSRDMGERDWKREDLYER